MCEKDILNHKNSQKQSLTPKKSSFRSKKTKKNFKEYKTKKAEENI